MRNKLKAKALGSWFKWQSTCLIDSSPKFNPPYHKTNKQTNSHRVLYIDGSATDSCGLGTKGLCQRESDVSMGTGLWPPSFQTVTFLLSPRGFLLKEKYASETGRCRRTGQGSRQDRKEMWKMEKEASRRGGSEDFT